MIARQIGVFHRWRLRQKVFGLASLAALLVVWEALSRFTIPLLFPPPSLVLSALWSMAQNGDLRSDLSASLRRVGVGYATGAFLGIVAGMLTGRSKIFAATAGTVIQALRPIPAIAMVPFAVLWFGVGEASKYIILTYGVFLIIWINTHLGIRGVDRRLIWVATSLGASRVQIFFRILLPAATDQVVVGMRTAIATAYICLVAAELAGASSGLGYRIETSHLMFQTDRMMAALVVLGISGALSDSLFSILVSWAAPWYGHRGMNA